MNPDEALIFKQFDTADPEVVGVPHVAFANSTAENPVPPRLRRDPRLRLLESLMALKYYHAEPRRTRSSR